MAEGFVNEIKHISNVNCYLTDISRYGHDTKNVYEM